MQTKIQINLFGALQVSQGDDHILVLRRTKYALLLAYLTLQAGQEISREKIADLFWPDGEIEAVRNRLRQEISLLKRQLNTANISCEDLLDIQRDKLRLRIENVESDVVKFQQLLEKASRAVAPEVVENYLTEAGYLYRGPLLCDFDDLWIMLEREALENQYVSCMRKLGELLMARGDREGAANILRSLQTQNPLHEEVYVDLMHLYAEMGKPTLVRQQYRELERVLRDAFDDAPSETTRDLAESLCREAAGNARFTPSVMPSNGPSLPFSSSLPVHNGKGSVTEISVAPLAGSVSSRENGSEIREEVAQSVVFGRFRRRVPLAIVSVFLVMVCLGTGLLRWRQARKPYWLQPVWMTEYHAQAGEQEASEGRAMITDAEGNLYLCGLTKTDKEDVDILLMKFSPNGERLWENRYSSPEHDCDRAFSITIDREGVFVAGETYVPDAPGVVGGWYLTTLKYNLGYGELQWAKRCPNLTQNEGHHIPIASDGRGGVYVSGTSLRKDGTSRLLIVHYNSKGELLWQREIQTPSSARLIDMTGYGREGVLVCGDQQSEPKRDKWLGIVALLDFNGNERWRAPFTVVEAHPGSASAQRITVGPNGSLYVAGAVELEGAIEAAWVARLSSGGGIEWQRVCPLEQAAPDVRGLQTLPDGSIAFCANILYPDKSCENAVWMYDATGKRQWGWRYGKVKGRYSAAVCLAVLNDTIVVGSNDYDPVDGGASQTRADVCLRAFSQDGKKRWEVVYDRPSHPNENLSALLPVQEASSGTQVLYVAGQWNAHENAARIGLLKYAP